MLESPARIHGMVENSFVGEREHALWRVDKHGDEAYLLVVSNRRPMVTYITKSSCGDAEWMVKNYDERLEGLKAGNVFHFHMDASPTRCISAHDGKRGRVEALTNRMEQKEWLMRKAKEYGFLLDEDSFDVMEYQWKKFFKKDGERGSIPVTIFSTTFDGFLTVTDPIKFRKALTNGIGKGKAFGQGLLTIMRC
jgi:CRISPR system Cascade subunit CasE